MTPLFTHYVYDSQGRCLKELVLAEDASPEEVVQAYLAATHGVLVTSIEIKQGVAWFTEMSRLDGKKYVRYAFPDRAVSSGGFPEPVDAKPPSSSTTSTISASQEPTKGTPVPGSEIEVNARVVGHFNFLEAMETLWPGGYFAHGREPSGSAVFRFIVDDAASEDDARAKVARLLLSVPGVAPHDVRVGPLASLPAAESEDDLEEQLESLLDVLTPEEAHEVWARIAAAHGFELKLD